MPAQGKTRPRGRTALLIAAAALLGITGGTAVGYTIQAGRAPTPLPPLNQPALAYPAKPLPPGVVADHQVRTDGDLRKLLLPRPAGAREPEERWLREGWMGADEYAEDFVRPNGALAYQLELGIRRTAVTSWDTGADRSIVISLTQYRPGDSVGAVEHGDGLRADAADDAGGDGEAVKGSGNGRYYVLPVWQKAGYEDLYEARAYVHRGDVLVEIHIFDSKKISGADIRTLAERQLERL
ncbi:hypothetical protein [Streptomyces purpureus]|uniref:Uncharacterized protein n=1 Tax=Streptomyces purpureus TaxID=1951 RepID=A0A918LVC6_9ACTN|nr:hypothetical protein [Streptomyces purpureus]GGT55284.1 hypothetical protein GCM10014713_56280 [Streptomyces purpureus]